MKQVKLPGGEAVAALGQGTCQIAEDIALRAEEIATLRLGLDMGLTLIDTAEMYGDGRSEILVGEALAGRRDEAFIVSKVYPHNATLAGTRKACTSSLKRLRTDRIDLYLLHWPGSVPLQETVSAMQALQQEGKIRYWGVSNFDAALLKKLGKQPGGEKATTNQVLYNLMRRGIEWDLLPYMRQQGLPLMAYSPIEQGALLRDKKLIDFAQRHAFTPAQAALAWLLAQDGVIVIPKTSHRERLKENAAAAAMALTPPQKRELDLLFPPPVGATPLAML